MTDYEQLVKALRCCAGAHTKPTKCPDYGDSWCGGNCLDKHLIAAADAIEALLKEKIELIEDRPEMVEADGHWEWRKPNGEVLMSKRGEWVRVEDGESYHYECSRCGERPLYSRYGDVVLSGVCPMCGAKMTGEEDEVHSGI